MFLQNMKCAALGCLLLQASRVFAHPSGCTSIVVGRKATVDGSPIVTHSADGMTGDWRMVYVPAKDHPPGSNRVIMRQDAANVMYPRSIDAERAPAYQPVKDPINKPEVMGYIPQVEHTFALWENMYSYMNEHGLALGESTCAGALLGVGVYNGGTALFTVANLMQVTLERCKTARCAVETMGFLAETYGFFGEDPGTDGAGETVTAADADGDAWVFHVTGGVKGRTGALWVAQRVPEEHVAVVANSFTIKDVDLTDSANFVGSENLLEDARVAGVWDGRGTFNWQKYMAPDYNDAFEASADAMDPLRMWRVFTLADPDFDLKPSDFLGKMPFSVKPARKVSNLDVMNWHRDTFDGTEFDMTLGTIAGPWQSPRRLGGAAGSASSQFGRPLSMFWTLYCTLAQPALKHPVLWFAADMAKSSVFVPFYSEVLQGDGRFSVKDYGAGSQLSFSMAGPRPAWWAFNFVSNWMEISHRNMSRTYVYPKVAELQSQVLAQAEQGEKEADASGSNAIGHLAELHTKIQERVVKEWWSMADMLIVRYNDQYFNFAPSAPTTAANVGYPAHWLQMIGPGQRSYYPDWSKPSKEVPSLLLEDDLAVAKRAAALAASCDSVGTWSEPSCHRKPGGAPSQLRLSADAQYQGYSINVMAMILCGSVCGTMGFFLGSMKSGSKSVADEGYSQIAG